ncbi:MAG: helix-turn-helix transcriptional regulator, partial [Planctomycetota bacterium]
KFEFKKTVQEEINRLRIELIKKMLMTSREPVYHIANQLQFTDPEHFSRYFKNLTGMSPSVFRRSSVNAAIMRQEPFVKL